MRNFGEAAEIYTRAACAPQRSRDEPIVETVRHALAAARRECAPYEDSCVPGFLIRYCTVTSVPTGISEKNLRAVSSGNRMQPCDAG